MRLLRVVLINCHAYKVHKYEYKLLKPYEIARNNRQTTYQSKLYTTAQSNHVYLLSYNDLFVFVLMHLIRVEGN